MRLLIATPAYGGLVTTPYLQSLYQSFFGLQRLGVEFGLTTIANEALISRARNTCAAVAMHEKYDKLMFIDADVSWKWEDLEALIRSDKPVIGGTYPKKSLPIEYNYNVLPLHRTAFANHNRRNPADHALLRSLADPATGEIEVLHLPTGFLMIDVRVLHALKSKAETYRHLELGTIGGEVWDFFPVRVRDKILESEDWAFCTMCRDSGIPVYLNTNVIVNHTGSYTFG